MVTHRDRLVILSFMTSPYQNMSTDSENDTKSYRTLFHEGNNEFAHTHLIEKFHSGTFDEHDYFDTHEKLEVDTPSLTTTLQSFTTSTATGGALNKLASIPMNSNAVETNKKQQQQQQERMRGNNNNNNANNNRQTNNGNRGQGGRKHSGHRQHHAKENVGGDASGGGSGDDIARATYSRKDKQNRKGL